MTSYKKLDAWIFSMEMVKEIYRLTKMYPKEEMFGLTSQTKRAVVSIPSNIAEGLGRNFKKDSIQFLHISRGSAYEVETLLSVAVMTQLINQETYDRVNQMIEKTIRLINGLIKYLENQQALK
ncbi:MAG: four helix bundle protein [Bacteroidota bacterium]|nr:four helix bundle protein [Bacteroidota bacterium]MDP4213654.1 four helix bundle protein [Bacteroidota bacterium]MDP4251627.1 four helix bundle protein [Bacteroidota bacterium]